MLVCVRLTQFILSLIIENIWFDYKWKREEILPLKNKLSWRGVFTAGFYVSLIVALKWIKGRKIGTEKSFFISICVCLSVQVEQQQNTSRKCGINQIYFPSFSPLNRVHESSNSTSQSDLLHKARGECQTTQVSRGRNFYREAFNKWIKSKKWRIYVIFAFRNTSFAILNQTVPFFGPKWLI